MMKTKAMRLSVSFLLVLALVFGSVCAVSALEQQTDALYTNPDTGYQVLILDIEQARVKRKELYYFDSAAIFAINMGSRKITIQTYGDIRNTITDSKARSITDNVSHYATSKDYYSCTSEAFKEMSKVLAGEHISEPMKITSYAVIAAMLGVILALLIAFSKRNNPLRREYERASIMTAGSVVNGPISAYEQKRETIHVSSGSSGGSSGCGGGGCSSCGGGGGGCGGGGSSSF